MARTKTTTATKPTRTTNKAKGRKDKAPADKAPAEAPRDNRYLRASRIIVKNLDINAEAVAIAASMSESTAGHCLAAWEGVTQAFVAGLQGQTDQDIPLDKAQALMYRAFGERDERRRVQLAKDALALCPDCADAYVLLAEHAASRKEALRLKNEGDFLRAQRFRIAQRRPAHASAGCIIETGENVEQCGFSAARWTNECDPVTALNATGGVLNRDDSTIVLAEHAANVSRFKEDFRH